MRRVACLSALLLITALVGPISKCCAQAAEHPAKANLTYRVITAEGGGYGYDVFADGKPVIHQTTIPGQPGASGFKKKSVAGKVAKLVIRKLKNKEIPPTITEEELRKLKVIE